jgi:glycosyltransferase involved in cell wall biosynthesis
MKVALVTDFLTQLGGAEKVVEVLHELWPEAPIYTLVYDEKTTRGEFSNYQIRPSSLQKIPLIKKIYRWSLPFMPRAVERLNFDDYDIVFSVASAFAKGVVTKQNTKSICYLLTPTRYLWSDKDEYMRNLRGLENLARPGLNLLFNKLRQWDLRAAKRPNLLIAISQFIKKRIEKYYQRTPEAVIYSPVEVDNFFVSSEIDKNFVVVSRPRYYKRIDLIIDAFNHLKLPIKIIGMSKQEGRTLFPKIGSNIEFLGYVSEKEKAQYLSHARAFIHPQEEDFGITAVESMASGRPVIAYRAGGALETVKEGKTGVFFDDQNWQSLADAVLRFNEKDFNPEKIRQHSLKFSKENFKKEITELVQKSLEY